MRRTSALLILGILLLVVVATFSMLANFVVDWLWFDALGFSTVFFTVWRAQAVAFATAAALAALVLTINGLVALRMRAGRVRRLRLMRGDGGAGEGLPVFVEFAPDTLPWRPIVLAAAGA